MQNLVLSSLGMCFVFNLLMKWQLACSVVMLHLKPCHCWFDQPYVALIA